MPDIYQFSEFEILAFFLVLIRMSTFIVSWPVFGVATVPTSLKILFALVTSLMIFPIVGWNHLNEELTSQFIIMMTLREAFIGVSMGFLARMFFFTINIAGQIISVSMGISSIQLFNPSLDQQSTALEQVQLIIASLFFLAINGHHLFIAGIIDSFRIVPLSEVFVNVQIFGHIGQVVQEIMVIGVQLCAPVMIAIFLANVTMAVIGRAVPQINVLITSLPVNILVGYVILIVSVPLWIWEMHDLLELTTGRVFQFLRAY